MYAYTIKGEAFCDVSTVVIAQMDALSNDVPPGIIVGVGGYPTMKLFPATNKEKSIDFTGRKTLIDMAQFILKHASVKFPLPEINFSELELKKKQEQAANAVPHMEHVRMPPNPLYKADSQRDHTEL